MAKIEINFIMILGWLIKIGFGERPCKSIFQKIFFDLKSALINHHNSSIRTI